MKTIGYLLLGGLAAMGIVALPATIGGMWSSILRIRTETLEQAAYHRFLVSVKPEEIQAFRASGDDVRDALRHYQGPVQ